MSEPQIRIVIPASNEEARISTTIREYCEHFGARARVVVVANGCSDRTEEIVEALQTRYANLALISIGARIGKGGAVRAGFSSGIEPLLGFTDADGSTSAREFDRLITSLREFEVDGIIGSRWTRGAIMQRRQPLVRRIASRVFNGLVRVFFGLPYRDTQCGAKIFQRGAIVKVLPRLEISNFAFDVDLLYQLRRAGCSVLESPIAWSESFTASKVRLFGASCSMLLAIVLLRVRDSLLSQIAPFEYLGRRSLIPVCDAFTLLILTARQPHGRAVDGYVNELAERWQTLGHTVHWLHMDGWAARLKVLLWYALFGRREYDALVEVASSRPYFIPAFSMKPAFLILSSDRPAPSKFYKRCYGAVQKIVPGNSPAPDRADAIVQQIKSRGLYVAVFDRADGNWSINYTDSESRVARRQKL